MNKLIPAAGFALVMLGTSFVPRAQAIRDRPAPHRCERAGETCPARPGNTRLVSGLFAVT
jgi:hypothetical protein